MRKLRTELKLEGEESCHHDKYKISQYLRLFFTHTAPCGNVISWCKCRLLQIKDKMKLLQHMYIEPLTYNQMV